MGADPYIYNERSHLLYQNSDQPYNFVSVMIDAGYYNASTDISSIIRAMTEKWSEGDFDYSVMPMYSVINYYVKDGSADDILINALNIPLPMRHLDIPYIPANTNDKALKMRMRYDNRYKEKAHIRFIAVKTSLDYQTINEIAGNYNYPDNQYHSLPMLKGRFGIEGITDSVFFYDFDIDKRYNIADAFYVYYYLKHSDIKADIRFTDKYAIVVTPERINDDCSPEVFSEVKRDIMSFTENASYDAYFYSIFMPYLLYINKLNYMNGISARIETMRYGEFCSMLSIEPHCVFAPQSDSTEMPHTEIRQLNNGVTLLYRHIDNSDTEISILIANKLKNEFYFSKPFASDIVLHSIMATNSRWEMMPLSPLCDYAIITGVFGHNDACKALSSMLKSMSTDKLNYRRDIIKTLKQETGIYADTLPYEKNYITARIDAPDDALYLTEGELNVLRRKLTDGENIIIAVNSSSGIDDISAIIMGNISTSSIYTVPYYRAPVIQLPEDRFRRIDKWRSSPEAFYFVAVLLNYPSSVFVNSTYAIMPVSIMDNAHNYANNLYFNMMQRSALTILPALSYYLWGDYNALFNIIGIY